MDTHAAPHEADAARLDRAGAEALVARRLNALGHPPDLLVPDAVALLVADSAGSGRRLRSGLAATLFLASTEDAPSIGPDLVRRALASAQPASQSSPAAGRALPPWVTRSRAYLVAGCAALAAAMALLVTMPSRPPASEVAPGVTSSAAPGHAANLAPRLLPDPGQARRPTARPAPQPATVAALPQPVTAQNAAVAAAQGPAQKLPSPPVLAPLPPVIAVRVPPVPRTSVPLPVPGLALPPALAVPRQASPAVLSGQPIAIAAVPASQAARPPLQAGPPGLQVTPPATQGTPPAPQVTPTAPVAQPSSPQTAALPPEASAPAPSAGSPPSPARQEVARPSPALQAALPQGAPASVLLLYAAADRGALARLRPLAVALEKAGITDIRAKPIHAAPPRRAVSFFYSDDLALADVIAKTIFNTAWPNLGGNSLQPSLVLIPSGLPPRKPGTVEVQLP